MVIEICFELVYCVIEKGISFKYDNMIAVISIKNLKSASDFILVRFPIGLFIIKIELF